jgi:hypothetical protein
VHAFSPAVTAEVSPHSIKRDTAEPFGDVRFRPRSLASGEAVEKPARGQDGDVAPGLCRKVPDVAGNESEARVKDAFFSQSLREDGKIELLKSGGVGDELVLDDLLALDHDGKGKLQPSARRNDDPD